MEILNHIIKQFEVLDSELLFMELNSGLINKTFKLELKANKKSFILQKINTDIFPDYKKLMTNIINVSEHIDKKLKSNKFKGYKNSKIYFSSQGTPYYKDVFNSIWRLSDYIPNTPPNLLDEKTISTESGKIIAKFHLFTLDLPINIINETIPDFHNIKLRWENLIRIVNKNPKRLKHTKNIFSKLHKYEYLIDKYDNITKNQSLPNRVVHNDPKLSNILFQNNTAISLIDHDTIMPGFIPVDFGDAVRSLCNTSDENETNLEKVDFDFSSFQRFASAYLMIMKDYLTRKEIHGLTIFPLIITFEQIIRFYTDYLENDIYYQVDYPEQNLNRSKVQLKLLNKMHTKSNDILNHILHL